MNTTHTKEHTEQNGNQKEGRLPDQPDLRDYFAAKAMQAQLTYGKCRDMTPTGIADYAYEFADAMLAERAK